jgi:hypothetical protein
LIKVENISVYNFENAFKGMRNPLESWDQSDSYWVTGNMDGEDDYYPDFPIKYIIGEKDLELALKLIKAGSDHSKFMRQIFISMDITAPLYFFKEFDTYKVSTVANSTSTMHKIGSRLLTYNDFSWDYPTIYRTETLNHLNQLIAIYQESEDRSVWREIIQDLPDSYNQLRTWTGNYQCLRNMYHSRKNHKLEEWRELCKRIGLLPYSELITCERRS